MNKLFFLLILIVSTIGFVACGDNEDPMVTTECETDGVTYAADIKAIFDTNCSTANSCHGAGSQIFPASNYEETSTAAGFGRMTGAINHEEGFSAMPPSGVKMDQCDIDKIEAWIADGTPE